MVAAAWVYSFSKLQLFLLVCRPGKCHYWGSSQSYTKPSVPGAAAAHVYSVQGHILWERVESIRL